MNPELESWSETFTFLVSWIEEKRFKKPLKYDELIGHLLAADDPRCNRAASLLEEVTPLRELLTGKKILRFDFDETFSTSSTDEPV